MNKVIENQYDIQCQNDDFWKNYRLTDTILKEVQNCEISHNEELLSVASCLDIKQNHHYQKLTIENSINIIAGKAKSRKSFFLLIIIAALVLGEFENLRSPGKGMVLYFDTEQGRARTILSDQRLKMMVGERAIYDHVKTFDLRNFGPMIVIKSSREPCYISCRNQKLQLTWTKVDN